MKLTSQNLIRTFNLKEFFWYLFQLSIYSFSAPNPPFTVLLCDNGTEPCKPCFCSWKDALSVKSPRGPLQEESISLRSDVGVLFLPCVAASGCWNFNLAELPSKSLRYPRRWCLVSQSQLAAPQWTSLPRNQWQLYPLQWHQNLGLRGERAFPNLFLSWVFSLSPRARILLVGWGWRGVNTRSW